MTKLLFGIPKKIDSVTFSWKPFIIFGVVLVVALGMRVYQWVRGPVVPTAEVESIGYEQMAATDGEADGADSETDGVDTGAEGGIEGGEGEDGDGIDPASGRTDGISPGSEGIEGGEGGEDVPAVLLPDAINLAVPFVSQAPLGIWDAFTEETCEEASLLMVDKYYEGAPEGSIDPAAADADFRAMVAVEESMDFGVSISTAQFLLFAEAYDGTVARVIENPSVDDLRALLAAGHPVIVPAFGRSLGNPFFTGEGPLYHMLVLRGYTPTTFITNDPGTRHGENYQYAIDTFMNAIGDWDGDSPDGGSRVIVLEP